MSIVKNIFQALLPYIIFILAAAFLFFEMGLQVSPSVMVQDLMRDIGMDAATLGMMASVYYYSYTLMQIPAGLLFDRLSARYLITLSLTLCACGAAFFAVAHTVYIAALGRFLTGLGSAFAFISVLFVAAEWFPSKHFALLAGIAQLLAAVGAMCGEIPLAASVAHIGWRATMQWIAIVGGVIALIAFLIIRDHPKRNVSETAKLIHIIQRQLKAVLRNGQTWMVALYSFAVWAPITAFAALWGVPYIVTVFGLSSALAASACAMIWVGIGLGSLITGWWSDRSHKRRSPLAWCAALGVLVTSMILYVPGIPALWIFVLMFLFGVASSGQALSFAVVKDNNRPEVTGTAIGFNNMAVVSGGALFQPVVGILLDLHTKWHSNTATITYTPQDYRFALIVLPLCYLLGLVTLIFIRETHGRAQYKIG